MSHHSLFITHHSSLLNDLLRGNSIFALHQTARIMSSGDVFKPDITRQRTEKRNAVTDEHRNPRDNEPLNKPSSEKSLNGYAAIYINVLEAASIELRDDLGWVTGQMFDYGATWRGREWLSAENEKLVCRCMARSRKPTPFYRSCGR